MFVCLLWYKCLIFLLEKKYFMLFFLLLLLLYIFFYYCSFFSSFFLFFCVQISPRQVQICGGGGSLQLSPDLAYVPCLLCVPGTALPQWISMINDTQLDSGEQLHWECRATGKPRPTYRWLRNGEPLNSQVHTHTHTHAHTHTHTHTHRERAHLWEREISEICLIFQLFVKWRLLFKARNIPYVSKQATPKCWASTM